MPKIRLVCRARSCEYEKHCNRHCLQPRPEHESEKASLVCLSPPLCVLQPPQHFIHGTCPRSDWCAERAAVSIRSTAIGTACSPGLSMNQRVHPSYARLLRCASCSCTSIALMTHAQDQTGVQSEQLYEKHCNRHCLQSRPEHKSEGASLVHPPPPLCILQPPQHCINGTCPRSDWCAARAAVSMRSTSIGTACSPGLSINRRVHLLCARLLRCASCSCISIALMTCPRSDWYAERAAVTMRSFLGTGSERTL
ncbi:hypothetical protein NDU88_008464 [Pleurodeles waltl]|uniref:Uncharacterized protein n=1 Tax=Pleurodeles waltl TaxID=8319 RepID=A0AAV7N522_PLEWA|nr:hypothetical protein NDU88_008464 [Pleurodeles waltl]